MLKELLEAGPNPWRVVGITPKALALRRWNCESIEQLEELVMLAEQKIRDLKK